LAASLFKESAVIGAAAQISGLSLSDFIEHLAQLDIDLVVTDQQTAKELKKWIWNVHEITWVLCLLSPSLSATAPALLYLLHPCSRPAGEGAWHCCKPLFLQCRKVVLIPMPGGRGRKTSRVRLP
jgi:hypothetical protein